MTSLSDRRLRIAQVLAFLALVASLVGALGPASKERTTYSWPPRQLPASSPSQSWYTPLLLIRRTPDAISAKLPCSPGRALPHAVRPVPVLATVRFPQRSAGLIVTRTREQLVFRVGDSILDRVPVGGRPGCSYELRMGNGAWSLEGGPSQIAHSGALGVMPIVNGIFSALDLRSGTPPEIEITTAVHATHSTLRQTVSWSLAALLALAALLLAAIDRRPRRPWGVAAGAARSALANARPVDAAVGLLLIVWWLVAPAAYDDGWVLARLLGFASSGGFSNYYDALGANLPLEYWLDWSEHWLTDISTALPLMHVPALACLATTWIVCRWTLARIRPASSSEGAVLWALASAFAVGALASGMSLRTEPQVALLGVGVLACTVRFLEREAAAPLALSAVLVALALTSHPAGIVSLAPVLVAMPRVLPWLRRELRAAATILTAGAALLIFLAVVGSDLAQRSADTSTLRTYGQESADWRVEVFRYANLFDPYYGTPMRRASVALIALAVLAFLLRARRTKRTALDLPPAALAVSLLLLVVTPAKLPFHFGALLGVAALAVATETARVRDEESRARGWSAWPFLAIGAGVLAAAWSWAPRLLWNDLDLRTLDWTLGFESRIGLTNLAAALPLVLLAVTALVVRLRRSRLERVPWRVASWLAPTLALPLVAFTVGVLVADALKTDSWTRARQNLESLSGSAGCGLADDVLLADRQSIVPLATRRGSRALSAAAWIPPAPVPGLATYPLGAAAGALRTPWLELPSARRFGLFVAGRSGADVELEWGRRSGAGVESVAKTALSTGIVSESQPEFVTWRFFAAGDLPPRVQRSNRVRLSLADEQPADVLAVAPVAYANTELTNELAHTSPSLVAPGLFTYMPCARLPRHTDGVTEVPGVFVALRGTGWPALGRETTPFDGLRDLYGIDRYSLSDSGGRVGDVVVYEIDPRIPGAAVAPPSKRTFTS